MPSNGKTDYLRLETVFGCQKGLWISYSDSASWGIAVLKATVASMR
ncbi:hypothetical protein PC128_g27078 [Phytophthora cactorum]|nr:hypothetical protein PC120_g21088 [Phytophthora cactorum]KAG3122402.1 hypothetical protein C6341_g26984 [Phytophthora cactorum]KAG3127556.1 hypothetical protein PC128_g27078 [Phytophthora cactorum]